MCLKISQVGKNSVISLNKKSDSEKKLLKEGEILRKVYFKENVILRFGFNNNSREISLEFFFEEDFVLSIESFQADGSNFYDLESIESIILKSISKGNIEFIIEISPEIKKLD